MFCECINESADSIQIAFAYFSRPLSAVRSVRLLLHLSDLVSRLLKFISTYFILIRFHYERVRVTLS